MNERGRSGKTQSGEIWFLGMIVIWAVGFLELRLISEGWTEVTCVNNIYVINENNYVLSYSYTATYTTVQKFGLSKNFF